tara:strand:- start:203 stop:445 length:243 start_codon:yes stop_codon:yes gene_type:complete
MGINSQIKSRSITSKASSACKINMGLVEGARDMHNATSFIDHNALTAESIRSGGGGVSIPEEENKEDETDKEDETNKTED